MVTYSSTRRSSLTRDWRKSCRSLGRFVIWSRPTSFTTRISESGQRRFPRQLPGHHRACAKEHVYGISMSTSQETSMPLRPLNRVEKSTRRFFPVAISRSSSSSTRLQRPILTDTIINIELDKVTEPWRMATKLTGMYHPARRPFRGCSSRVRMLAATWRQKIVLFLNLKVCSSGVFCSKSREPECKILSVVAATL